MDKDTRCAIMLIALMLLLVIFVLTIPVRAPNHIPARLNAAIQQERLIKRKIWALEIEGEQAAEQAFNDFVHMEAEPKKKLLLFLDETIDIDSQLSDETILRVFDLFENEFEETIINTLTKKFKAPPAYLEQRTRVIHVMSLFGKTETKILPLLTKEFAEEEYAYRNYILSLIESYPNGLERHLPKLLHSLFTRGYDGYPLSGTGGRKALRKRLTKHFESLETIELDDAVVLLAQMLKNPYQFGLTPNYQYRIATILQRLGPKAIAAEETLRSILMTENRAEWLTPTIHVYWGMSDHSARHLARIYSQQAKYNNIHNARGRFKYEDILATCSEHNLKPAIPFVKELLQDPVDTRLLVSQLENQEEIKKALVADLLIGIEQEDKMFFELSYLFLPWLGEHSLPLFEELKNSHLAGTISIPRKVFNNRWDYTDPVIEKLAKDDWLEYRALAAFVMLNREQDLNQALEITQEVMSAGSDKLKMKLISELPTSGTAYGDHSVLITQIAITGLTDNSVEVREYTSKNFLSRVSRNWKVPSKVISFYKKSLNDTDPKSRQLAFDILTEHANLSQERFKEVLDQQFYDEDSEVRLNAFLHICSPTDLPLGSDEAMRYAYDNSDAATRRYIRCLIKHYFWPRERHQKITNALGLE